MLYHLKFESQQQADAVLYELTGPTVVEVMGEMPEQIEFARVKKYAAIMKIGKIYKGNTVGVDNAVDGYHVNVLAQKPAPELEPFQVFPKTPHYIWMS
jgi:hypothetical protein